MGNPFQLNFNPFQATSAATSIGGSRVGGGSTPQPQIQRTPSQEGISEVGQIGANKKADFMNGLGGHGGPQTDMNGNEIGHKLSLIG